VAVGHAVDAAMKVQEIFFENIYVIVVQAASSTTNNKNCAI